MANTALIVCDFQNGIVSRFPGLDPVLDKAAEALEGARAKGDVLIVHIGVRFRPGHPEISPRNVVFSGIKEAKIFEEGTPQVEHHPKVAPKAGEVQVSKRRYGSFSTTELDLILRAHGVHKIVLTGIATQGVILSTVREAFDLDYEVVVLRDACADQDEEVHRVLLDKVISKQAKVITVEEYLASLKA